MHEAVASSSMPPPCFRPPICQPPANRERGYPGEAAKGFFGLPWKPRFRFPDSGYFPSHILDVKFGGLVVDPVMLNHVAETVVKDHNLNLKTNYNLVKVIRVEQEKVCGVLWYLSLQVQETGKEVEVIHKVVWQGVTYAVIEQQKYGDLSVFENLTTLGFKKIYISEEEAKELATLAMEKCIDIDDSYTLRNYELYSHFVKEVGDGAGYKKISKSYLSICPHQSEEQFDVMMIKMEWLHTLEDQKALMFAKKCFTAAAEIDSPSPIKLSPPKRSYSLRSKSCYERACPPPIIYKCGYNLDKPDLESSLVVTTAWFTVMKNSLMKNIKLEFVKVLGGFFKPTWGKEFFLTLRVKFQGIHKTCITTVWGNPRPGVWIPSILTIAKERKHQYLSFETFCARVDKEEAKEEEEVPLTISSKP